MWIVCVSQIHREKLNAKKRSEKEERKSGKQKIKKKKLAEWYANLN